jgi:hypothetical protein
MLQNLRYYYDQLPYVAAAKQLPLEAFNNSSEIGVKSSPIRNFHPDF